MKKIKQILVVPHSKYKKQMPNEKLDVLFMDYETTEVYNPNTSQWVASIKPSPSEWNVTHFAKGKRTNRRIANYYEVREQYPSLFTNNATVAGGVSQVGNTLVLSGQTPLDVINAYLTGEIPTKNGKKYVK